MTTRAMRDFGYQVTKARNEFGWSREKLAGEALTNTNRKGYVGEVEKGARNLSPETIDKFIQALDLPDDVAKAALMAPKPSGADPKPEPEETKQDQDAVKLLRRARQDEDAPATAEALLIALAYDQAGGPHIDLFTAYTTLKLALEAVALYTRGWSHLRLAERSSKPGHLKVPKMR